MKNKAPILFLLLVMASSLVSGQDHSQPFNYPLEKVWQFTVDSREATGYETAIYATPLFDDLNIYIASANGSVTSFYKGDQQVSWQFLTADNIKLEMHMAGDSLIVAAGNDVFSLEKGTGVVRWVFTAEAEITSGIVGDDENIYFSDGSGSLHCLAISDGKGVWVHSSEEKVSVTSDIFLVPGLLVYGNVNGEVISLNRKGGKKVWTSKTRGAVRSGFCEFEGIIYFGSDDNYIYAINRSNGSIRWRQRTAGDVRGRPIVDDDYVYISARDRSIRVIYRKKGSFSDHGPVDLKKNSEIRPLILDDVLVYAQGKEVSGVGTRSNLQGFGVLAMISDITSSPVFDTDEKLLYLGLRNGTLQAISSRNQLEAKRMVEEQGLKVSDPGENLTRIAVPAKKKEKRKKDIEGTNEAPDPVVNKGEEKDIQVNPGAEIDNPEVEEGAIAEEEVDGKELPLKEQALALLDQGNYTRAAFLFRHHVKDKAQTHYTVSLGLYCKEDSIKKLLDKLSEMDRYLFARQFQDKVCFFVCSGIYPDKASAEAQIEKIKSLISEEADIKSYRLDSFIK